jgi:hypothetical protein
MRPSGGLGAVLLLVLVWTCPMLRAQQPDQSSVSQLGITTLSSGIDRLAGMEPASRIQYTRLILKGSLHAARAGAADPPPPTPSPMLIAQCTLRPGGKYMFEMFANFGGATDLVFYPPWKQTLPQEPFPPTTQKVTVTMDFRGYTHVKPLRREWEIPDRMPGQYRFIPPGIGSANLEEIAYDLRYLLALPTLRLTLGNTIAEFLTTPLLDEIHKEALCKAASL